MRALRHVHDVLAVQDVLRDAGACRGLLGAQAVLIVLKGYGLACIAHGGHLLPMLPGVRPCAVVRRIAYCIVLDRHAIMRCQLIFPNIVSISVRMALCRRQPADTSRSVRIGLFRQDVAAEVILLQRLRGVKLKHNHIQSNRYRRLFLDIALNH